MALAPAANRPPPDPGEIVTVVYVQRLLGGGRPDGAWQVARRAGVVFPTTVPHRAAAMAEHIVRCWGRPRVRERVVAWLTEFLSGAIQKACTQGYAYLEELVEQNLAPECVAYLGYRAALPDWLDWVQARMSPGLKEKFTERWASASRLLAQCTESPHAAEPRPAAPPGPAEPSAKREDLQPCTRDLQRKLRRTHQREQQFLKQIEREKARHRREVERARQAAADLRARRRADKQVAAVALAERERLVAELQRERDQAVRCEEQRMTALMAQMSALERALEELCAWSGTQPPPLRGYRVLMLGTPPALAALRALVVGLGGEWRHSPLAGRFRQALQEVERADIAVLAEELPDRSAAQLACRANANGAVFLQFSGTSVLELQALLLNHGVPRVGVRPVGLGDRGTAPRRRETATERRLRLALKEAGIAFEQEAPIAGLRVDFLIRDRNLVVEVDGLIHALAHKARRDRQRDALLAERGYAVLRIPSEDLRRPGGVRHWIQMIRNAVPVVGGPALSAPVLAVAAARMPTA